MNTIITNSNLGYVNLVFPSGNPCMPHVILCPDVACIKPLLAQATEALKRCPIGGLRVNFVELHAMEITRPSKHIVLLPNGHDALRNLLISRTLEIKLEGDGRCAPWQAMKCYYHSDLVRFIMGKPRMKLSIQGFIDKFLPDTEVTDQGLKNIYIKVTNDASLLFKGLTLKIKNGGDDDAPEVFTEVYTKVEEQEGYSKDPAYPSVFGSCMSQDNWDSAYGVIGIGGEHPHPVVAYTVPQLSLAYMVNPEGYTVARALVNNENKQIHRVYRSAPSDLTNEEATDYANRLEEEFLRQLKELGYTRGTAVLVGVTLKLNFLDSSEKVCSGPYLDGSYTRVNTDGTVGSTGSLWNNHNPPIQSLHSPYECYHCGESIDSEDDIYYNDDGDGYCEYCYNKLFFRCRDCDYVHSRDDMHRAPDGDCLCESCFNNNYTYCEKCGDVIARDDSYSFDDNSYCRYCIDDVSFECDNCYERFPIKEALKNSRGYDCCSSCLKEEQQQEQPDEQTMEVAND